MDSTDIRQWYVAGLEHHADELDAAARLTRLRAKRLGGEYAGEALTVFSEAMKTAAAELRRGAKELRSSAIATIPIKPDVLDLLRGPQRP